MLTLDPVVMGAGVPPFEQRGDSVRPRQGHVAGFGRAVARDVLMACSPRWPERGTSGHRRCESASPARRWCAQSPPVVSSQELSATANRTRPSLSFRLACVPTFSTAIITGALSVDAPCLPAARPPTNDSSTSTTPARQLTLGTHHRSAQLVQPRPRGLIGTQAQHVVQILRRGSVLLRGHQPDRGKPRAQRRTRAVKDGPGRHRGLTATRRRTSNAASRSAKPDHHRTPDTESHLASANPLE